MSKDCSHDGVSIIPGSEKDITEAWIEKVVGMTPIPNSISVEGNIQDGLGFLSYMVRVSFQTKDNGMQHIIVKLLPMKPEFRELNLNDNMDLREIQFYDKVKPQLIEIDPSLQENICAFYAGKFTDRSGEGVPASMLVMEDLRPLGYQMYKPETVLWKDNLTKVVTCLARIHCAGLTLELTRNMTISEMFPFCLGAAKSNMDAYLGVAKANMDKLDPLLEHFNVTHEVRAAYQDVAPYIEQNFRKITRETLNNPCLIHGDLWSSNIMVKEERDAPVKFIDWQLLGYRDPVAELVPTIMACVPLKELRKNTLDTFSKLYYDSCVALGENLGRSKTEFQECFDTWGMAYAYLWYLLAIGTSPELEKRCSIIFDILHNEYKICDFLKKSCK